jgi:RNA polymerase sigma-70 factor (ECF subfamily)
VFFGRIEEIDMSGVSADSTNPGSTDSGLLNGMRSRDDAAWTQFANEYAPLIYVWCRKCDLQSADSLDVSQQVFQAVSRSITTFSREAGTGSFRGWLFVITRNLIRNHLTRTLRGPQPQGGTSIQLRLLKQPESIDEKSLSDAPASAADSSIQSVLDSARARFDERTWTCFWLVAMEGQSAVEVAAQLGMKPAAVRQAKYRVAQRLRRDLDDHC